MRVRIASVSLALACSSMATQATANVLQPIRQWAVDYGDTQCTAVRSFGTAADPIVLGIVPSIGGETYKLIVSVQRSGPKYAQEIHGTVDFGHDKIKSWMLHYGGKDVKLSNYEFQVSAKDIDQAGSATTLGLRSDTGDDFEFALSEMPSLLDALHKCNADLQQYWNMNEKLGSLNKAPKGDLRPLFDANDYPAEAISKNQGGTTQFRLLIDEKGNVAGCDVMLQSGVPILDAMSCQVLKERAKFSPAIDTHGKAVRSVVTTPPIVWRMGGDLPPLEGPTLTGRRVSQ